MTFYGNHSRGGAIRIRGHYVEDERGKKNVLIQYYQTRTFISSVTGDPASSIDAMRVNEFLCVSQEARKIYKDRWELQAKLNPFVEAN